MPVSPRGGTRFADVRTGSMSTRDANVRARSYLISWQAASYRGRRWRRATCTPGEKQRALRDGARRSPASRADGFFQRTDELGFDFGEQPRTELDEGADLRSRLAMLRIDDGNRPPRALVPILEDRTQ